MLIIILGACGIWALAWFVYALGYDRGWRDHTAGRRYWNGGANPPD